ncbi:MAG: reactive intermediate/imine deaminase [Zhongshania aliphaticivorans]|jgi:reactive intermediate/imine deaminase|uniref:Reactive intermediate/imine deaminase n=1 Tax=Zhongshania aliphaticivorans TaxID=1470434 RepID=A0A127MA65_9GAMM|nr:RidA family protein [Zhongshania aliphaticivorans]AMO70075.1 reactive intermediate/imine deaminase [Zhongshania aliphaticivorans]
MSTKEYINTLHAPEAIGTYSQAVKVGNTVYLSGQIPLVPETMTMVDGGILEQATQVFKNLSAVADASGGSLNNAVKVNISLTDLSVFAQVNEVMAKFFTEPYPARACVQVAALPRGAMIEVEVILAL